MRAIIVGMGSEIAQNLAQRLERDGWEVSGCSRAAPKLPFEPWDLLIFARGTMGPIGKFFDLDEWAWIVALRINAIDVLTDLRALWPNRNAGAKVMFLGGPNMANPSMSYSSYRCGKAILEAIVPTLNAEYPEHRFMVLHPGVVKTKFHEQTLAAGERAANIGRIRRVVSGEEATVSHDEVYARLLALIA